MNSNYVDITLVVDRSGSMNAIRDDAEGGINAFIKDQASKPGKCVLTLVDFDTEYRIIHNGVDIRSVGEYKLEPNGMTALLDAVGQAVTTTGARLAALPESERPGLVICLIVTDGAENSSKEYKTEQIHQMITHQREAYKWQFSFLGVGESVFADAVKMGFDGVGVASYSTDKSSELYGAMSDKVSRMRMCSAMGEEVDNAFTPEELKRMV